MIEIYAQAPGLDVGTSRCGVSANGYWGCSCRMDLLVLTAYTPALTPGEAHPARPGQAEQR
jgi:hypothetical protein